MAGSSIGVAGEAEVPRVPPGRRVRALLLAELANPHWRGVPLVGWRHAEAIAQFADVHLVTHVRNRVDVLAQGWPVAQASFIGPLAGEGLEQRVGELLGREARLALDLAHQHQFELRAWELFQSRIEGGVFDLVHRITPTAAHVPSVFAERVSRVDVPFVLGPVNGVVPWPRGFVDEQRREGGLRELLRPLARLVPQQRTTRQRARAILAGSASAYCSIPHGLHEKTFYLPENAVDPRQFDKVTDAYAAPQLRVVFAGHLVAGNGVAMLLRAAAPFIREKRVCLEIIGDGPERPSLLEIADAESLRDGVLFSGWIPHEQIEERLLCASVFAFPAIHATGGGTVLEAMMLGLVPLVVGYGGPFEVVDRDSGIRVPMASRANLEGGLRAALLELVTMRGEERRQLGVNARRRALTAYAIDVKRDKTEAVYDWVVGRGARPELVPAPEVLELYGVPGGASARGLV